MGTICRVCEENIRAEAAGKHRRQAKDTFRETSAFGPSPHDAAESDEKSDTEEMADKEKRPRDFKSMAEYLEYLKRRR
jgi:hypothetical protein